MDIGVFGYLYILSIKVIQAYSVENHTFKFYIFSSLMKKTNRNNSNTLFIKGKKI